MLSAHVLLVSFPIDFKISIVETEWWTRWTFGQIQQGSYVNMPHLIGRLARTPLDYYQGVEPSYYWWMWGRDWVDTRLLSVSGIQGPWTVWDCVTTLFLR